MGTEKIDKEDKVCWNCKYLASLIGVGQGLRCSNPNKEKKFEILPSRRHTCEMFEILKIKGKP